MKQYNLFTNEFQNSRKINEIPVDFQDIQEEFKIPGFHKFPGAVNTLVIINTHNNSQINNKYTHSNISRTFQPVAYQPHVVQQFIRKRTCYIESFQVHGVELATVLSWLWVPANTALTRPLEIDFQPWDGAGSIPGLSLKPTQHRLSRCWVGVELASSRLRVGVEFWRHNFKQLFKIYVSWFKF